MRIGYLRVSTKTQNPDRQVDGLRDLCDKLYIERLSAVADKRPVFDQVLGELKRGDTLFVWDLDRAFRSTEDALFHEKALRKRGIKFHAMNFEIETQSAEGRYAYILAAAAAERERMKISERTIEGLNAARARGQRLGPPAKMTDAQIIAAKAKIDAKQATLASIAAASGVHPSTVLRSIRRLEQSTEMQN
jgi:DNA invertase Pin-like site-specific DNA recombinase